MIHGCPHKVTTSSRPPQYAHLLRFLRSIGAQKSWLATSRETSRTIAEMTGAAIRYKGRASGSVSTSGSCSVDNSGRTRRLRVARRLVGALYKGEAGDSQEGGVVHVVLKGGREGKGERRDGVEQRGQREECREDQVEDDEIEAGLEASGHLRRSTL